MKPELSFDHWRDMFGGEVLAIDRVPFSLKKPLRKTVVEFVTSENVGVLEGLGPELSTLARRKDRTGS